MACSSYTIGLPDNVQLADESFRDCFALCDNSPTLYGRNCTSFYYEAYSGSTNGEGQGECWLVNFPDDGFQPFGPDRMAAVRQVYLATTTTSSAPSSSWPASSITVLRPI